MSMEQVEKYCCWYFTNCRESKTIVTKEEAFPNHGTWKDPEFFIKHPTYLIWVEDEDIKKSAWHWFHYCPNCGHQYSTNEEITYWTNTWNPT
jgi:ribosomal protein S12 methylthiotransferase accessory factor YcaO